MSQGTGGLHVGLDIKVYDPCPIHQTPDKFRTKILVTRRKSWPFFSIRSQRIVPQCACPKKLVAHSYNEHDMSLKQFCAILMPNIFNTALVINQAYDTSGSSHTISANSATSALQIVAGSGTTAPNASTDVAIQTQLAGADGAVTPTHVGTASADGTLNSTGASSTTFLVVGTMTNSTLGNETWGNIGLYITIGGNVYMLAHDQTNGATGYPVSAGGSVAVTYTVTST